VPLNLYARPAGLKTELQLTGLTSTTDATFSTIIERASRFIDAQTYRHFYSRVATIELGAGGPPVWSQQERRYIHRLFTDVDVVSVTSLKVDEGGDGTFEITMASGSDYWTFPQASASPTKPIRAFDIVAGRSSAPQITSWPTSPRRVELIGIIGYDQETTAAGTVDGEIASSVTALVMDAGHGIDVGDTIIAGSEQCYVSAYDSGTETLTITRSVNGTTAATISDGAAIVRRVFPAQIVQATMLEAQRIYLEMNSGNAGVAMVTDGGPSSFRASWPAILNTIRDFRVAPAMAV